MIFEQQENEIAERLNGDDDLTAIASIRLFPDTTEDYKIPVKKGLVSIIFLGEKPDKNQSVAERSYHTTITFSLSVQSPLLRGATGVYAISELIKKRLTGFPVSDCDGLEFVEHEFGNYENNVWEHILTFSARSMRNQFETQYIQSNDITNGEEVFYTPPNLSVNENISV